MGTTEGSVRSTDSGPASDRRAGASETPKERLAYWAYRTAEILGMALPEPIGRRTFVGLGALAAAMLPGIRSTVAANQAQVLGVEPSSHLDELAAREAFALYARYWYDTFRLRTLPPDEVLARVTFDGLEHLDAALEAGTGVICAVPHMGNWDAAGRWMALRGYRIASVAEVLRPRRLFELFLRHREDLGMRIVALTGDRQVARRLSALLADNWVVGLVADRDLTGRGVRVEMFGRARALPAGPAVLSISTGAPLLPGAVYTTPTGWHIRVGPAIDVERTGSRRADVTALTRAIAAEFERAIAARPADWHLFQPGWPP